MWLLLELLTYTVESQTKPGKDLWNTKHKGDHRRVTPRPTHQRTVAYVGGGGGGGGGGPEYFSVLTPALCSLTDFLNFCFITKPHHSYSVLPVVEKKIEMIKKVDSQRQ